MAPETGYQRILLKLSGEALMGDQGYGIDTAVLQYIADESTALRYLQERHKRFLEGVIEEPPTEEGIDGGALETALEPADATAAEPAA